MIMGRGRAKGKKLSVTNQEDLGSGEEEKIPAQKRRGRPQKSLKEEIDEDESQKIDEEDSDDTTGLPNKDMKGKISTQNGKKRKRNIQVKEKIESVKEENGSVTRSNADESNKSNGFRQNGNRRKNKPRRAAEAIVECN
ncbi:uncharacterized protein LOC105165740 [Sesamum indicum]|uniref:Uncharacterized protein LOC105165740 n=1 Tax=Sesamum indicum TaxID=4182 RepID=A0A6I9TEJ2_SESIN|nr:uncharacterized protein LOC105165740 [Sesamum indicum]XP_011083155.1 uncharacterized protein LOC105165740 [Sesamum indicum]XP_011083157.1 uncharacterized protein LOC105165740 [Sesamum indicum]XP_020550819.1 uncharacterized protein LOC105165740 [Sesamum indicum]XP_020550820.1 uncharacterized protein LOC105165740 [Sesamum indicum]XP_020550821.1 uncharacterized protein LOC105165740 [Sesamum indicum]XP_020550822.1 uncharacterized protein LOC105165740 [Sesamum indicum]XP_020550823.1 uncharacte